MKNFPSILLFAGFVAISSPVPVMATPLALQSLGDVTYDPNTGLEWLNLSFTAGQSYQSVLNGWGGYTTAQGFQFATGNQVVQLFTDAGATSMGSPSGPVNPANLQAATLTLSLLGTTLAQPSEDRSWMFYAPSSDPGLPSSMYVPTAVFGTGVVRGGYPEEGFFLVPGLYPLTDYSSPEMASALVKYVGSVPDTASTGLLFGMGFGLVVLARKFTRA